MESGKAMVLSAISKQQRPFRARHITDLTQLDRRLVSYHLQRFVDRGWIEKIDKFYLVKDLSAIIDELLEATKADDSAGRPETDTILLPIKSLANVAAYIVQGKTIHLPMSEQFDEVFRNEIDLTIELLKQLKKWMNNYQPSLAHSAKQYRKEDAEQVYKWATEDFKVEPSIGFEEWLDSVRKITGDILDD